MPPRGRNLRNRVTTKLDAVLPARDITPTTPSQVSDAAIISGGPFTPGRPGDAQSEVNISTSHPADLASPGEQTSLSLTQTLSRTSGEATPLLQRKKKFNPRKAQKQPTSVRGSAVVSDATKVASTSPVQSTSKGGWAGLKGFLRVINRSAGLFGPLKEAAGVLVECIGIYEGAAKGRDEFKELQAELDDIFGDLQQHFSRNTPQVVTASIESLCKSIVKELGYVGAKQDGSAAKRYLERGGESDEVLACYRRIQGYLQRLSLNANLSMWEIVDEQATNARLDHLKPSFPACYNSSQATELKRGGCTPGTRVDVLSHMHGWVYDRAAGSVYWLDGMAGTGKTTIVYSLCEELSLAHNLGASFFCSRLLPECRDVNQIVPSIAYQLAHFSRPFRCALSRVLEKERNVHTQLLRIQFDALIIKPLVEVRETLPEDLVVVVDALDECDNKASTNQILEALLTKTLDLPIKFLVTSRPEPEIRDQMKKQGNQRAISRLVLHELDKGTVQGDIETYLRAALERMNPSESQITTLVQRAGILFIYAATVVRYIGFDNFGRNPSSRLETVLNISTSAANHTYQEIDELYTVILRAAIDEPGLTPEERSDMKLVLNTVLCAREPLGIKTLSGLLGLRDIGTVHAALRPLWSVLHVVESSGLVTTLHASFLDYMFDPKRSRRYCCNRAKHEQILAQRCFECIKSADPQFNICRLESSCMRDDQVLDLSARVKEAISPELPYACRYWASHLERAQKPSELVAMLEEFLSARLLLWMEIMNLNKCMDIGVEVIVQAEEWCRRKANCQKITQLAYDAWRFVAAFALNPVSQSTPHIYISMLPFWPESSPIAEHYAKRLQAPMVPQGTAIPRRQLKILAMWSVDEVISRVAWSPDGTRIALASGGQVFIQDAVVGRISMNPLQQQSSSSITSIRFSADGNRIIVGLENGMIGVWDAHSGRTVLGPFDAHAGSVTSVALSPDGTRIVSGSWDKTVRMWDVRKGRIILAPLEGHTSWVTSVTFSPDGTRITSGSGDRTIRIWDTKSGRMLLSPLKAHTQSVTSVAFSPDGTRIVSGSYDKSIYIWDARNGQAILGPLEGHTDWVTSVAFSPDGNRIVSGSFDRTIRMWDAQNRKTGLSLLEGHTDTVISVTFSADGTRIVSGSRDRTIRIWDTRGGQTTNEPLEAHIDAVSSAAFSPDSTRIVSGADDGTIRIWDVRSGRAILSPLGGHTNSILAIAFLPDGTRIISGSSDRTIRLWDTQSKQTVLPLLEMDPQPVTSIAFSSDGTRIVSSSTRIIPISNLNDVTICMWDAQTGHVILGPFKAHPEPVTSIALSPDGTRIIAGHEDGMIGVWDAQDGQMVLVSFSDHTESVTSVGFSPDSTRIVSGSDDKTIRIWSTQSGRAVLGPLYGHTESVTSIAFSPDGTRIVSGSGDKTIRIWDTRSGQTVLGPLKGHELPIRFVTFTPDGTRIVSSSEDMTIRIWDVRTQQTEIMSYGSSVPPSWKMGTDGWVTDYEIESRLLVWVPPDVRRVLLPPRNILNISANESVGLNFIDARIGESWTDCYCPS